MVNFTVFDNQTFCSLPIPLSEASGITPENLFSTDLLSYICNLLLAEFNNSQANSVGSSLTTISTPMMLLSPQVWAQAQNEIRMNINLQLSSLSIPAGLVQLLLSVVDASAELQPDSSLILNMVNAYWDGNSNQQIAAFIDDGLAAWTFDYAGYQRACDPLYCDVFQHKSHSTRVTEFLSGGGCLGLFVYGCLSGMDASLPMF